MSKTNQNTSRRDFFQKLAVVGTAGALAPVFLSACGGSDGNDGAATAEEGFTCADQADLTEVQIQQRQNAEYVDDSPFPEKRCDNCQLYTEAAEGENCGGCQVLPGAVHPQGYCTLWVARQA